MGRYNEVQGEDYVLVIGNGTRSKRSNAMTMDWSGNVLTTGNVSANTFIGNIEYATKAKEDANGNIISDEAKIQYKEVFGLAVNFSF